jgi:predicted transcriptional regulator
MTDEQIAAVAKSIAHPYRIGFLQALRSRETLAPNEYAKEANFRLATVAYHCRELYEADVIEIKERVPVRGSLEKRYQLGQHGAPALAVIALLGAGLT